MRMTAYIDSLDFTVLALIAAALVSLMTSYIGVTVVLRRMAFAGAALAQLATAGIALSGLLGISCSLGAVLLMLLGVGFFAQQDTRQKLPSEGLIGAGYVAAGAMAVLFMALAPHTDSDMLGLLFGNLFFVLGTHFVNHTALAAEGGAGLDGKLVDEDVAADTCGGMQRQELLDREVAIDGADDIGVLAEYVSIDHTAVADDEFAVELDVAFKFAVETEVAAGDYITLDDGTVGDNVDGAVFDFHCFCHNVINLFY